VKRTNLALATYWLLFVIAPLAICYLLLGTSVSGVTYIVIFVVLSVIGERGFRLWKKLLKID
jgi:hypothetical protein